MGAVCWITILHKLFWKTIRRTTRCLFEGLLERRVVLRSTVLVVGGSARVWNVCGTTLSLYSRAGRTTHWTTANIGDCKEESTI